MIPKELTILLPFKLHVKDAFPKTARRFPPVTRLSKRKKLGKLFVFLQNRPQSSTLVEHKLCPNSTNPQPALHALDSSYKRAALFGRSKIINVSTNELLILSCVRLYGSVYYFDEASTSTSTSAIIIEQHSNSNDGTNLASSRQFNILAARDCNNYKTKRNQ